ncbi:MAG: hypothetical protein L0F95_02135 [Lactococcus sp.]|nr:hypothetical protein [Lactococcus sp.]MDN5402855.1 hypothetical protein [Lactococcus sp.]MDN5410084.1 hypothetical protein [Lactococcus sp.]MDN5411197.1 hypothetical protein [Lactococcus sp.]MDN5435807.1 hypothetical protein [Lactococcus sp.]MDN5460691.1 hypothetical protein [Lactococcus sp.]
MVNKKARLGYGVKMSKDYKLSLGFGYDTLTVNLNASESQIDKVVDNFENKRVLKFDTPSGYTLVNTENIIYFKIESI